MVEYILSSRGKMWIAEINESSNKIVVFLNKPIKSETEGTLVRKTFDLDEGKAYRAFHAGREYRFRIVDDQIVYF